MEKRPENNTTINLIKVAITGPESTGKSSIAKQLADYFSTVFVPEYAREYLNKNKKEYNYDDILRIAKGQLQAEKMMYPKTNRILFCDTEFIVTKIWSEHAFQKCDDWIFRTIENHRYDMYLLMDIDLPWEYDPLRQHPHLREYLFNLYKQELTNRNLPYRIVSGNNESRLMNAVCLIKNFFDI